MVLVIDTFEVPSVVISRRLFRSSEVVEVEEVSMGTIKRVLTAGGIYSIHKECFSDEEIRQMKYYFNEVVEVLGNVQYINKSRRVVKYYAVIRGSDGVPIDLDEIREEEDGRACDKTAFLPYVKAQEEEIVIFPDDED
ncbi:hypothetical protein [Encephalitozoon cuniculi GB-M1]|uniref:Uncharacterized protein n=2 Tax=Encephalitozoon cuniculi TaxID=6035 RepID=Q8SVT4_ENCCU|nr:uncharacterized protein ECU04_1010 [Encephalitozoon cuniculi GB-M1]AGE95327.1 hypothetical protein ECU04_1010 [Encephalitozoon cuniculi]KMV66304.1 hypothetical protein M970_040950 [Encephalitozoon cuniculi EcunIII-L]UYI27482.1 hypothetical protein J0A71_06g13530 [Encephalitozoon cuniculi]CAD25288.1 hypothetical protein [Encephalitozoon cuniculi GB-M1]